MFEISPDARLRSPSRSFGAAMVFQAMKDEINGHPVDWHDIPLANVSGLPIPLVRQIAGHLREQSMERECPTCGAEPGEDCSYNRPYKGGFHSGRQPFGRGYDKSLEEAIREAASEVRAQT